MNSTTVRELQGRFYRINGNQPILLDNPSEVWVVQSGSVALFAVTVNEGIVEGTRRYLFSRGAGEALFGTAPNSSNPYRQILAVPIGETELLKVDQGCLQELVTHSDSRVIGWIESWIKKIGSVLFEVAMPVVQIKAENQGRFSLINGQTFQLEADTVAWVQIQQGKVHWMGFPALPFTTTSGIIPVSHQMWLDADGAVQLVTETTAAIRKSDALLQGLSQLHVRLLHYIDVLQQRESTEELQRLEAQAQLNRQVTAAALGELASTLATREPDYSVDDSPLLVAAGAVGKALGVPIRPPGKWEDFKRVKEPLEAIMRASRIRMRQVLLQDDWWKKDCGPLIAYTRQDHQLVVLLPSKATRYEIFDPVQRTRTPVTAHKAAALTPSAYMFYRSLPDRALNSWQLVQFALKGRSRELLVILFMGIAVALLGMLTPQATAILIDQAIPDSDRALLLQLGIGLLAAAVGIALFSLTQGIAILRLETVSDASTQAAVWDRLLNLPVSFFRQYTTGDLHSRVTSISQIRRQLGGTTVIKLVGALFTLLNLGLLFYYSVKLALVAIVVALIAIAVTIISGILLVRKTHPLLELQGTIFGQTVQLINGISKLRVAGAEERAFATWSKNYSRQVKLNLSTQLIEDLVVLFNTVMPTLTAGLLFWLTIGLLTEPQTSGHSALSIGTFLAFNFAFGTFIKGATDLSNTITNIWQIIPQWKRAHPILETVPEVNLSKADPGRLEGRIIVDRVAFRYRDDGPLVLDQVSIRAEPGEYIALVGGSGSGKSTLFRLLLGFETPESGTIYYDGQDLSGLDIEAVRRQLGVVLQHNRIMVGSIFDNIASGAQITLDEAWEAARASGFADDIAAMPMAMHTVVSEGGSNLSGGQRQRLLIARALVLQPKILLFDEATSALDNKTQAIVSENLDKLQVTRITIAHRLSTIRHADRIYVLQAGQVVQQGSFEELAAQEGLFFQLMQRQMG
jgi:ATP-binding cassette subfamily C protein